MDRKLTKPDKGKPRSQTLPGLEQTRNGKLDNLCEGIADVRTTMNAAKQEEKTFVIAALQAMVTKGLQVYRHGGVELARVPGAERLRVRLTKEEGDADEADLEPADDDEEEGETDEETPVGDPPSTTETGTKH
jgi:hypothetical protein